MLKRCINVLVLGAILGALIFASADAKEFTKESQRGWLGVYIQDINGDLEESLDLKSNEGVLVSDVVKESPAEQAGIKQEDVIERFNGKKVSDSDNFTSLVRETSPGEKVELQIERGGKEKTLIVTVGRLPKSDLSYEKRIVLPKSKGKTNDLNTYFFQFFSGSRIGVKVEDLTEQLGDYFGVEQGEGALITEVEKDMPADKAGLKAGDVIVEADGKKIEDTDGLRETISDKEKGDKVTIKVIRDRNPQSFVVEVQEGEHTYSLGLDDPGQVKIFTEKLKEPGIFWKEKAEPELQEQLDNLKQELQDLREQLDDLREKIR